MCECIQSKFFLDGKVTDCPVFKPKLINEGLSVYEVIRLIKNHLLFFEDHLSRLERSLRLAKLDSFHDNDELTRMITSLPLLNKVSEGNIKIVYNYRNDIKNHSMIYFVFTRYPSKTEYKKGVEVITYPFTREDPNKKIWLPDFRAASDEIIHREKIWEVLIVNEKKHVTEASRANLFAIKNGKVFTPPVETVLAGITRKYVINICREQKIPIAEKPISKDALGEYDVFFLTSTSTNILPIAKIDNLNFRADEPVLRKLMVEFEKLVGRKTR